MLTDIVFFFFYKVELVIFLDKHMMASDPLLGSDNLEGGCQQQTEVHYRILYIKQFYNVKSLIL